MEQNLTQLLNETQEKGALSSWFTLTQWLFTIIVYIYVCI